MPNMTNLHARAAKVAELNAKRTRGEWRVDGGRVCTDETFHTHGHLRNSAGYSNASYSEKICEIWGNTVSPVDELDPVLPRANAAAIAALPEAFALIAELDAALQEYVDPDEPRHCACEFGEALDPITSCKYHSDKLRKCRQKAMEEAAAAVDAIGDPTEDDGCATYSNAIRALAQTEAGEDGP